MKVLVTGGTGFIGSGVIGELLVRDITPVVLDRHGLFKPRRGCEVILGDVRDSGLVYEAVYHTDAFIHLAAVLGTQETVRTPHHVAETNVLGSLNVFQAAEQCGRRGVYIAVGNHWMNNPYSITKTTAERFAYMFNKELGTEIAVVRGLNVYGPGQKVGPVRKIMPNLIVPALKGEDIIIYGDGTQIMDMIYIDDIARVLVEALLRDHGVYDRAFEAGMGEDVTVNDLAYTVVAKAGGGCIQHVPMRPGEIPNSVVKADATTLAPLGITPDQFVSLEDGISRTIAWYAAELR